MNDPRVPPKKAARRREMEEGRALKEVKHMMRTFGVDESAYPDSLEASVEGGRGGGGGSETEGSYVAGAKPAARPPRQNLDNAVGFSTGTREDWNKVISVGKQPYGNQSGKGNAPPTQYNVQESLAVTLRKAPRT